MRIDAAAFAPATLVVKADDTVVWINKDPYPHTVTAPAAAFDSGPLQPEGTWTLTPSRRGEFAYTCTLHQTMKGMLRVE